MTPVHSIKPKLLAGQQPAGASRAPACRLSIPKRPFARRTFLGAALALGAAAITGSLVSFSSPLTGKVRAFGKLIKSLQDMTYESFLELTGVPLMARSPGAEKAHFTLKLASVTRAPAAARGFPPGTGQDYESLSLIFEGAAGHPASQSTYELEAPGRGRFLLFIVPMQPVGGLKRYQAIINRPLPVKPA